MSAESDREINLNLPTSPDELIYNLSIVAEQMPTSEARNRILQKVELLSSLPPNSRVALSPNGEVLVGFERGEINQVKKN